MTEAQQAHLRLQQLLRDKITTHQLSPVLKRNGEKYCVKSRAMLLEKLRKCEALGMTRQQMAFECGTSSKTIVRILGICGYRGRKAK
jgi:hypothetical protein